MRWNFFNDKLRKIITKHDSKIVSETRRVIRARPISVDLGVGVLNLSSNMNMNFPFIQRGCLVVTLEEELVEQHGGSNEAHLQQEEEESWEEEDIEPSVREELTGK